MTAYEPTTLSAAPTDNEFAAWLAAEVIEHEAVKLQQLITEGFARWVSDPEVDGVFAIRHIDSGDVLLVVYGYGYDFETSTAWDDLSDVFNAQTLITVTCPDGQVRHEPFDEQSVAETWADWGHACMAPELHEFKSTTLRKWVAS